MTAVIAIITGVAVGVIVGLVSGRSRSLDEPRPAVARSTSADVVTAQRLNEVAQRLEELRRRFDELHKAQLMSMASVDERFMSVMQTLGDFIGTSKSRTVEVTAAARASRVHGAFSAPTISAESGPPASVGPPAFSLPTLISAWNRIDWEHPSGLAQHVAHALSDGWCLSDAIKHRFHLLYRSSGCAGEESLYLVPLLGINISLLAEFFDGPETGIVGELIAPAEVQLREQIASIENELAKLASVHSSHSVAEVLTITKRGHLA